MNQKRSRWKVKKWKCRWKVRGQCLQQKCQHVQSRTWDSGYFLRCHGDQLTTEQTDDCFGGHGTDRQTVHPEHNQLTRLVRWPRLHDRVTLFHFIPFTRKRKKNKGEEKWRREKSKFPHRPGDRSWERKLLYSWGTPSFRWLDSFLFKRRRRTVEKSKH